MGKNKGKKKKNGSGDAGSSGQSSSQQNPSIPEQQGQPRAKEQQRPPKQHQSEGQQEERKEQRQQQQQQQPPQAWQGQQQQQRPQAWQGQQPQKQQQPQARQGQQQQRSQAWQGQQEERQERQPQKQRQQQQEERKEQQPQKQRQQQQEERKEQQPQKQRQQQQEERKEQQPQKQRQQQQDQQGHRRPPKQQQSSEGQQQERKEQRQQQQQQQPPQAWQGQQQQRSQAWQGQQPQKQQQQQQQQAWQGQQQQRPQAWQGQQPQQQQQQPQAWQGQQQQRPQAWQGQQPQKQQQQQQQQPQTWQSQQPQKQQQQQQPQAWQGQQSQQQRPQPQQLPQQQRPQPQQLPQQQRPQPQQHKQQPHSPSPPTSSQEGSRQSSEEKSLGKIIGGITELSLLPRRSTRPPKVSRGKPIVVHTNHLDLIFKDPNAVAYHYDVTVVPEKPFLFYRPALERMREKFYPNQNPAFDGKKNLYSSRRLPVGDGDEIRSSVDVFDPRSEKNVPIEVTIKFAKSVSLGTIGQYLRNGTSLNPPQEAIQVVDIVLRGSLAKRFLPVGRSYFTPPRERIFSLGDGYDLWYGFYQSAIVGWKPFLNVDVAHKGFPSPGKCMDHLCDFLRIDRGKLPQDREPENRGVQSFQAFIKDLKIAYYIPKGSTRMQKRTYKVLDLTTCARKNIFSQNGTDISVENYYRREYNYTIKYPLVPCLKCGSKEKSIALPLELCDVIEGQAINRKLTDNQTRNMVKAAATATQIRRQKIEYSMKSANYNNDPIVKEFGLTVSTQFTTVDARILDPPQLSYNRGSQPVIKGVWKSGPFISTVPLRKWGIINADRNVRMRELKDLNDSLIKTGIQHGMSISQASIVEKADNPKDVERYLQDWKREGYELAVIILPERFGITYAKVKQIAEQTIGILTQCLKSRTLGKLSPATVTNILLKINSKHNGINHEIKCSIWLKYFSRPIIVFGADVTHPQPGVFDVPSVAAVAASYEPRAFRYNMEWRFQPPKEEMIQDLEAIVKKQLLKFYKHNNSKPERIFFYRDGVSEGQFRKVLEIELQAIRKACHSLSQEYKPPITLLVVQKRHHTRFFPKPEDADGRNNNVPAGTVVDTKITHNNEVDFYLVSHASIQGTSRPTKYHVLWDDSNLSEDDLEDLTYYLCHLFTRCTRSVSYPAPTYYSHLAAFRARSYYENRDVNVGNLEREQKKYGIKEDFVSTSPMFFV